MVTTCATHSLHVGLGIHPLSWRDVIDMMCARLRGKSSILSRSVPVRLLYQRQPLELHEALLSVLTAAAAEVDCKDLQEQALQRLIKDIRPPRDEHVSREIIGESSLAIDTPLRRRGEGLAAVVKGDAEVTMVFPGGGAVTAPHSAEAAFRFIADTNGSFVPGDLPSILDDSSKLNVLEELVLMGMITRAPSPWPP